MNIKQKEIGKAMVLNLKQEEIGRVKLTDGIYLVVSLVNDEHLDLRLWVDRSPCYTGLRFYLPEKAYEGLKKLIDKVDKVYQERLDLSGIPEGGRGVPKSKLANSEIVRMQDTAIFQNSE